ncbi:MAG: hypothetical protein WC551_04495 [Patescibacteria group bacterium]
MEKPFENKESGPIAEVRKREKAALTRQETKAAKILRETGRLSRRFLLGLALLQGSNMLSDVALEKPIAHHRAEKDFDEQEEGMFDEESKEFLLAHEGRVSFVWNTERGKTEERKLGHNEISKAKRMRFRESSMPNSISVTWQAPQSMATGYQTVIYEDSHGNLVRAIRNATPQGTWITAQVGVLSEFNDAEPNYSVSVDLRRLGGPEMRNLAEGESIPSVGRFGSDGAYSAHSRTRDLPAASMDFDRSRQGLGQSLERVESMFGLKPGQVIQRVWLVDSEEFNAWAVNDQNQRKGTIMMSREMLRSERPNSGIFLNDKVSLETRESVIRHEAFHMVDLKYGVTQRMPTIHRVFRQCFMHLMNESEFLGQGFGGHANDNEREFFASLMADLSHPGFTKALDKLPPQETQEMYEAVRIVMGTIEGFPEFKDAPVLELMRSRLDELGAHGARPVTLEVAQAAHSKDLVAENARPAIEAPDFTAFKEKMRVLSYRESLEVYRNFQGRLKTLDERSAARSEGLAQEYQSLTEKISYLEKNFIFPKDWVRANAPK